jgi:hypothetical protein
MHLPSFTVQRQDEPLAEQYLGFLFNLLTMESPLFKIVERVSLYL